MNHKTRKGRSLAESGRLRSAQVRSTVHSVSEAQVTRRAEA